DSTYVYMMIKPRYPRDKQEFEEVRFAVCGPNLPPASKHLTYLPAMVYLKKPNGDTEKWSFKSQQINLVGVEPKLFDYEAPPKDWTVQQAPPPGATPSQNGPGVTPASKGAPSVRTGR